MVSIDPVEKFISYNENFPKETDAFISPFTGNTIKKSDRQVLFEKFVKEYGHIANNLKSCSI